MTSRWIALVVAAATLVVYWATIGRALTRIRPAILGIAVCTGMLALILQALALSSDRATGMQLLTIASFLSSAALLGGACTAMILGHWYLILPSMQVSHLQSIVKVHIVSMVLRVVVVGAAVLMAIMTWQPGLGPSFRHYITSAGGIFFWQRVLFGLFGPALLSYLTWETAKIRSTQSATASSTWISSRWSLERCSQSICCSRHACLCSTFRCLRVAPRPGTCAISACEPRQGRKAAALSRS